MTSDAESDFPNEDLDSDVGAVLDELSMENIRQISKNITRKFGARSDINSSKLKYYSYLFHF